MNEHKVTVMISLCMSITTNPRDDYAFISYDLSVYVHNINQRDDYAFEVQI